MQDPSRAGRMSPAEIRAGLSLGSLFALRMLGLFLILPVFAVHAPQLAGGHDLTLVGIALGAYGLTQAFLQIPYGLAADRYGRKRVIVSASCSSRRAASSPPPRPTSTLRFSAALSRAPARSQRPSWLSPRTSRASNTAPRPWRSSARRSG
jgi:MFS family permease